MSVSAALPASSSGVQDPAGCSWQASGHSPQGPGTATAKRLPTTASPGSQCHPCTYLLPLGQEMETEIEKGSL